MSGPSRPDWMQDEQWGSPGGGSGIASLQGDTGGGATDVTALTVVGAGGTSVSVTQPGPGEGLVEVTAGGIQVIKRTVGFADIELVPGTIDIWTLAITGGTPSSGDITLDVNGTPVGPIAWNAGVVAAQSAFDDADVEATVSGTALPGGTLVLTFDEPSSNAVSVTDSTLNDGEPELTNTQPGGFDRGQSPVVYTIPTGAWVMPSGSITTEGFNQSGTSLGNFSEGLTQEYRFSAQQDLSVPTPENPTGSRLTQVDDTTRAPFVAVADIPVRLVFPYYFEDDGTTGSIDLYLPVLVP